jgi:hypothetical protein
MFASVTSTTKHTIIAVIAANDAQARCVGWGPNAATQHPAITHSSACRGPISTPYFCCHTTGVWIRKATTAITRTIIAASSETDNARCDHDRLGDSCQAWATSSAAAGNSGRK